jgi:cytochrome c oxidase subunit 4
MSTEDARAQVASARSYFVIFAILLVCTYVTWQVAYFDLGPLNTVVALGIAVLKAVLVALFFMHVRHATRLTWVVILAGVFWLAILLLITMSDYLTRGWK